MHSFPYSFWPSSVVDDVSCASLGFIAMFFPGQYNTLIYWLAAASRTHRVQPPVKIQLSNAFLAILGAWKLCWNVRNNLFCFPVGAPVTKTKWRPTTADAICCGACQKCADSQWERFCARPDDILSLDCLTQQQLPARPPTSICTHCGREMSGPN